MSEYLNILILCIISIFLGIFLLLGSYFLAQQLPYSEKVSAYECGFDPFQDTRNKFEVKFYLVAILFIIFDLEIAFLFPWCIGFSIFGFIGFLTMFTFLFILTLGFAYEWLRGALDWI